MLYYYNFNAHITDKNKFGSKFVQEFFSLKLQNTKHDLLIYKYQICVQKLKITEYLKNI